MTAGKLLKLTDEQMAHAISLIATNSYLIVAKNAVRQGAPKSVQTPSRASSLAQSTLPVTARARLA